MKKWWLSSHLLWQALRKTWWLSSHIFCEATLKTWWLSSHIFVKPGTSTPRQHSALSHGIHTLGHIPAQHLLAALCCHLCSTWPPTLRCWLPALEPELLSQHRFLPGHGFLAIQHLKIGFPAICLEIGCPAILFVAIQPFFGGCPAIYFFVAVQPFVWRDWLSKLFSPFPKTIPKVASPLPGPILHILYRLPTLQLLNGLQAPLPYFFFVFLPHHHLE